MSTPNEMILQDNKTIKKNNIFLYVNVSDINIIINDKKKFGNFNKTFYKIWSKCDKDQNIKDINIQKKENNIQKNKLNKIKKEALNKLIIYKTTKKDEDKKIADKYIKKYKKVKNKIIISNLQNDKIYDIKINDKNIKCDNIKELQKSKHTILKKYNINKNNKILNNKIDQLCNKKYGIKNEIKAIDIFKKLNNIDIVDTSQKYYKKYIINKDFFIGGRFDGIDKTNNKIIEIKCRTKKLYDYPFLSDEIQVLSYLYISDYKKGYIIQYLKNDISNIKIFDIKFNTHFYENYVLKRLKKFYYFYCYFLTNDLLKQKLINYCNNINLNFDLEKEFLKFVY